MTVKRGPKSVYEPILREFVQSKAEIMRLDNHPGLQGRAVREDALRLAIWRARRAGVPVRQMVHRGRVYVIRDE